MSSLDDFSEITRRNEPLAPYTWMKIGGAAEYFIEPRNADELAAVVECCHQQETTVRLLGGGSNLLVQNAGVTGVVLHLINDSFKKVEVNGTSIRAGSAALLSRLISSSVEAGLAGFETLAGIPGTVGGALHGNAGGRIGDIGQFVKSVEVITASGERFTRTEDELTFAYRSSSVNELAILEATFELTEEDPAEITRRMRKLWIMKKASQPLAYQSAGCIFKNPRGLSAGALIEKAGLKGTKIGEVEISERHANFFVTHPEASSDDVLELIEVTKKRVMEESGVDLELEIEIW